MSFWDVFMKLSLMGEHPCRCGHLMELEDGVYVCEFCGNEVEEDDYGDFMDDVYDEVNEDEYHFDYEDDED